MNDFHKHTNVGRKFIIFTLGFGQTDRNTYRKTPVKQYTPTCPSWGQKNGIESTFQNESTVKGRICYGPTSLQFLNLLLR